MRNYYQAITGLVRQSYEAARSRVNAIRADPGQLWTIIPERIRNQDPRVRELQRKADLATRNLESAVTLSAQQQQSAAEEIAQRDEIITTLREDLVTEREDHKARLLREVREVESRLAAQQTERIKALNAQMAAHYEEYRAQINSLQLEYQTQRGGLQQLVGAQKETIKALRNSRLIVPLLRAYEAINPATLTKVRGIYLDNNKRVVYVTPAFENMTGVPEERLLADEEFSRRFLPTSGQTASPRASRIKLTVGKKEYNLRQRAYQITDENGEIVGTFINFINLDRGMAGVFSRAKEQTRRNYAVVRDLIQLAREAISLSTPKPYTP